MIYADISGRLGADAVIKDAKNGNKFVTLVARMLQLG